MHWEKKKINGEACLFILQCYVKCVCASFKSLKIRKDGEYIVISVGADELLEGQDATKIYLIHYISGFHATV